MKKLARARRHKRIKKKMKGDESRPRLVVFRSKKHLYAQIVNDANQKSLAICSTLSKEFKAKGIKTSDKTAAKELGKTKGLLLAHTNSNEVMLRKMGSSSADAVGYAAIVF